MSTLLPVITLGQMCDLKDVKWGQENIIQQPATYYIDIYSPSHAQASCLGLSDDRLPSL